MDLAESALARLGAKKIVLQSAVGNSAAIRFYLRRGYKEKKLLKDYYAAGKDAAQFEKALADFA